MLRFKSLAVASRSSYHYSMGGVSRSLNANEVMALAGIPRSTGRSDGIPNVQKEKNNRTAKSCPIKWPTDKEGFCSDDCSTDYAHFLMRTYMDEISDKLCDISDGEIDYDLWWRTRRIGVSKGSSSTARRMIKEIIGKSVPGAKKVHWVELQKTNP